MRHRREAIYWWVAPIRRIDQIYEHGYANLIDPRDSYRNVYSTPSVFARYGHRAALRRIDRKLDKEDVFEQGCVRDYLDIVKEYPCRFDARLIVTIAEELSLNVFRFLVSSDYTDMSSDDLIQEACRFVNNKALQAILESIGEERFRIGVKKLELCGSNFLNHVRFLVKYGFDPNQVFISTITSNRERTVRFLVNRGVDVCQDNDSPIQAACRYKRPTIIQYLFDQGSRPSMNLLPMAIDTNYLYFNKHRQWILPTVKTILRLFPPTPDQIRESLAGMVRHSLPEVLCLFSDYVRPDDIHLINTTNPTPPCLSLLLQWGVRGDITPAINNGLTSRSLPVLLESGLPFRIDGILTRLCSISNKIRCCQKCQIIETFTRLKFRFPDSELVSVLKDLEIEDQLQACLISLST